ncbi:hypothetical protein BFJ63_vAg17374 [Fusarium oxysporum f. sp. narcissi]|uniref:Uncharacterized protein n=1 Tax=Fusarium oxysporum f. sp. narcissi TaxID=451672 RepID=A0A4Q2UZX7_FUSOX|nr:hypothetical protein BFJ63_vAg17374 [Fusarium oxysporum f. sp. narcissi]
MEILYRPKSGTNSRSVELEQQGFMALAIFID